MRWFMCLFGLHDIDIQRGYHSGDMIGWETHTCKRPGCNYHKVY